MNEVKVFDSLGKLKKIISKQTLITRSKQQWDTPALFLKNKKGKMPWSKSPKTESKVETP